MCFNMVILNPSGRSLPGVLVGIVEDQMKINKHGFSFHAIVNDNDVVLRTLDAQRYLSELKNIAGKSPKLLHIHLRLASAGAINEDNIHMWRVRRYYISHNGSVASFACDSEPYLYLHPALQCDVKSDTLQLIESSEFVKAIDTLDSRPKELWRILTKYGLYGVMFMTNEHEVIAVSVRKPLYIYATRDLLIFVNEPIQFARVVKRFGFKLSLGVVPQKSYRNIMIRYDVKRMKPLFFRPKPKPSKQKYDYDYLSQDWWWAWK